MTVRFDDSLPILAKVIACELGDATLDHGLALRDASGRLAFFSADAVDEQVSERLSSALKRELGAYARQDRVFASANDLGVAELFNDPTVVRAQLGAHSVSLLDRRLVGADWLRAPAPAAAPPPRLVFSSLKGGVGRSTALAVASSHFAARGLRILTIDMDMEAPGLGALLLDDLTTPEFGIIDALVENGLGGLDETFLADLVGASPLAEGRGRIDVVPAFGARSLRNPRDVLSKIARAYTEDVSPEGNVQTVLDQTRQIVDGLAGNYDVIMIDARAGLHETAAAPVLGLGAEVLLFGLDDPQTFQGYRALFAHLSQLIRKEDASEFVDRLTMVQGKAPLDESQRETFAERCRAMFSEYLIRASISPRAAVADIPAEPFGDVPWQEDDAVEIEELSTSNSVLAIADDREFRNFDPMKRRDLVMEHVYQASYGAFLDNLNNALTGSPRT